MGRIRLGVYLGNPETKIGPGKVALLRAIGSEGSVSAAARSMGMAYRHAWTLVDELNHCFAQPVVRTKVGGPDGGGAELTAWGRELVACFEAMERAAGRSLARHLETLEQQVARGTRSRSARAVRAR